LERLNPPCASSIYDLQKLLQSRKPLMEMTKNS
jgi:hypothetical protein